MTTLTKSPQLTLEERIEYASVTESRESFLKLIDAVEAEPLRRHIVTKHGTPRAVLLSFAAYELLTRVAKQAVADEDRRGAEEAARVAFHRMAAERGSEASTQEARGGRAEQPQRAAVAALAGLGLTLVSKEDIKKIAKQVVTELQREGRGDRGEFGGAPAGFPRKFLGREYSVERVGFGKSGKAGKVRKNPAFGRER